MDVQLVMFKDDGERKEFSLSVGQTSIGRREECDLRVPLPEISRRHAMLIVTEKNVTIRDLGSANGTYVNNKRISEQELSAGDHIVVGPVVFTLQIDGDPADVRQVQTRLEARPKEEVAGAVAVGAGSDQGTDDIFDDGDDPISALEALAASDDTAAINLEDSTLGDPDD